MRIKPLPTIRRWNPARPQHCWVKKIRHYRNCAWCEMSVKTNPEQNWSLSWSWPADRGRQGGTAFQESSLPACAGPRPGRRRLLKLVAAGAITSIAVDGAVGFETIGRAPVDATAAIERAIHDSLVRLVNTEHPQPELTDLGDRWLRICRELEAAPGRAA